MNALHVSWKKLVAFLGTSQEIEDEISDELTGRYEEVQRHHHTPGHLEEIFAFLAATEHSAEDEALLIAATFWHDAIYHLGDREEFRQNEYHSAALAAQQLRLMGADEEFIATV